MGADLGVIVGSQFAGNSRFASHHGRSLMECEMENTSGKSRARLRWIFLSTTMGLAVNAPLCFAQEDQNASYQTATILATIIAAVSAIVAVIGAVIASRSAGAAMKSALAAMISAQKKYDGTLLPAATNMANQKIDRAKNFSEAIDTPFATVLTIIFSVVLGLGVNLLLSRSDSPSALAPASPPAAPASPVSVSAPPPPTSTASASPVSASAPPPPTSTAAASDRDEIAGLVTRGRAYLSDGDVALARVFLRRAAERDDAQAALALGGTYDPAELRRLGIPNFQSQADSAKAREWYRRAADLGSAAAVSRLEQLSKTDR
jgi:TPR repeat protein